MVNFFRGFFFVLHAVREHIVPLQVLHVRCICFSMTNPLNRSNSSLRTVIVLQWGVCSTEREQVTERRFFDSRPAPDLLLRIQALLHSVSSERSLGFMIRVLWRRRRGVSMIHGSRWRTIPANEQPVDNGCNDGEHHKGNH